MPARSAGLLLFRSTDDGTLEVLLVHPGGPFWAKKDAGAWSIPKGEHGDDEDPLDCARREFAEELGTSPPDGEAVELGEVRQKAGKRVTAWAVEGDLDPATITSNTFEMEWPRGSGRLREFPEVDRAEWFDLEEATVRILEGQRPLLEALAAVRASTGRSSRRS
jgi:predicted NUDIX family NTP pyrophosphohydrolase